MKTKAYSLNFYDYASLHINMHVNRNIKWILITILSPALFYIYFEIYEVKKSNTIALINLFIAFYIYISIRFILYPILRYIFLSLKANDISINTISIDEKNAINTISDTDFNCSWSLFLDITHTKNHIFMYLDKHYAIIIPKRAFDTPLQAQQFFDLARLYWENAKNEPIAFSGG